MLIFAVCGMVLVFYFSVAGMEGGQLGRQMYV